MTLSQHILGLHFSHPLITAAGMWTWTADQWRDAVEHGAAGITTKSYWAHEHTGNAEPVFVHTDAWTLNAVGLPDKGPAHVEAQLKEFLPNPAVPLIVSLVGLDPEGYLQNARQIAPFKPSAFEINMSSPTFLKLRGTFFDADEAASIIPAVKKEAGDIPVFVKLSPNIPDIGAFAARCVEAGVDGITAINTLGTGMAIDLKTRTPILSAKRGGVSGPGIKPLSVRCIADIYDATKGAVPITGVGGVMTGEDVVELMMAGASLVGLATAILREGMPAFGRIRNELEIWCEKEGVSDITELTGVMHRA